MKKTKKWLAVWLALVVGCASFGAAVPAQAATQYTGVTTSEVNVRVSPNSKSTKIAKLKKGEKVVLTASVTKGKSVNGVKADMNFYKLNTGGYVAASYIKVTGQTATATPTATPAETSEVVEDIGTEDPDVEDIDVDNADSTDGVDVEGDLDVVETTDDEIPVEDESSGDIVALKMIVTSTVNVRESPSTSSSVLRKLTSGSGVTAIRLMEDGSEYDGSTVQSSWYELRNGGFVSASYLQETDSSSTTSVSNTSKPVTTTTATATANATLYSSPNNLATKKGTLSKGESKTVSATYKDGSTYKAMRVTGTWYKLSNGYFVKSGDVKISSKTTNVSSTTNTVTTLIDVGDGVVALKNVNIRKGPSTDTAVVRLMTANETALVEEVVKSGGYAWLKLQDENGYVRADFVRFDADATVAGLAG